MRFAIDVGGLNMALSFLPKPGTEIIVAMVAK